MPDHPADEAFMCRCIELAKQAAERGNTPVGSVVVLGGRIVGEGAEELPVGVHNRQDGPRGIWVERLIVVD
jgi:pyrimidine deaminase RibD-like protein